MKQEKEQLLTIMFAYNLVAVVGIREIVWQTQELAHERADDILPVNLDYEVMTLLLCS